LFLNLTGRLGWVGPVSLDLTQFASDPAAGESLRAMRDGKWRKARDAAKTLCKMDRPRYLPLLVEVNIGLAREMIAKGLLKDAESVIDYLATIAPPESVVKLRAELTSPTPSAATRSAGGGEIHWAVALQAATTAAAGNPLPLEDMAFIDALVTDGFSPPVGAGEAADRLAAELAAVRDACAATGDGRWDDAKEALRILPRDSIFQHWRMFFRGARHAFAEEWEMARKYFADLPPVGALARAARTLDPELPGRGPAAPVGVQVPFFLAATGQPATWATAILDAEAAGKLGKTVRAYQELKKALKGAFPDDRPGLAALLTEGVLPFSRNMTDDDIDDGFDLLETFASGKSADPDISFLTIVREACMALPGDNAPAELERTWGSVLLAWSSRDGADPQRDAVGWLWLGQTLARLEESEHLSLSRRDYRRARKALEKSVKADPESQDGWLALLALLEKSGDAKEHNRLLGELVKRFPQNKKVLQLAGNEALNRKTYTKALKNLRAALDLDPLDRNIKCSIAVTLVRQALDLRKKKMPAAAVWQELEPLLEDSPSPAHFMLARWIARLRRGLLESETEAADAALAEAARLAPSTMERLFLEEKLREAYRLPKRKTLDSEWHKHVQQRPPGWEEFARIFPLADFSGAISPWSDASWERSTNRLDMLVSAMIRQATDKDFAGLADFLERAERLQSPLESDSYELFQETLDTILRQLEGIILTAGPSSHTWLHLTYLLALEVSGGFKRVSPEGFFQRLDLITSHAEKSGDTALLAKARSLRGRMENQSGAPDPYDCGPGGPPPSLMDMLADAMNSMEDEVAKIYGSSRKPASKPASKPATKPATKSATRSAKKSAPDKRDDSGDQMDFFS
jgi:tetratricopeptide (TPR) repeat protein